MLRAKFRACAIALAVLFGLFSSLIVFTGSAEAASSSSATGSNSLITSSVTPQVLPGGGGNTGSVVQSIYTDIGGYVGYMVLSYKFVGVNKGDNIWQYQITLTLNSPWKTSGAYGANTTIAGGITVVAESTNGQKQTNSVDVPGDKRTWESTTPKYVRIPGTSQMKMKFGDWTLFVYGGDGVYLAAAEYSPTEGWGPWAGT